MFCSACGSEVAEGLRFCNRCGASLAAETQAPPRLLAFIIILSLAFAAVTIFGLFVIAVQASEMMSRHDWTAETYIFIFILFLTVLGADALIIRQISRLLTVYLQTGGPQNARAERRDNLKASVPRLVPPPAAAETTALHTKDTHEVPADTNKQELPTRKL